MMPREELKLGTGMRDKGKDSMLDLFAETFLHLSFFFLLLICGIRIYLN